MYQILVFIGLLAVLFFLFWLLSGSGKKAGSTLSPDEPIDAADAQQIGFFIGLSGGSIADAITARFALQRFEEIHGRKATVRDMGAVVGLSKNL